MYIEGKKYGIEDEYCEETKEVVSKYGITMVCSEEDGLQDPDLILPQSEECENMQEAVSKYGITVVCEE